MNVHTDQRLKTAFDLFNSRDFFACHDALEEIWQETLDDNRQGLQGLIHAAVALFHFSEGNLTGARKMHDSALRYLASYEPDGFGLDLARFRREFDACFAPLLGNHAHYPADARIDESLIPQWHLSPTLSNNHHEHF